MLNHFVMRAKIKNTLTESIKVFLKKGKMTILSLLKQSLLKSAVKRTKTIEKVKNTVNFKTSTGKKDLTSILWILRRKAFTPETSPSLKEDITSRIILAKIVS